MMQTWTCDSRNKDAGRDVKPAGKDALAQAGRTRTGCVIWIGEPCRVEIQRAIYLATGRKLAGMYVLTRLE